MFCTACGSDNSDTAAFCRGCGARLDDEHETVVARRPADASLSKSDAVFDIGPTLKFVKVGYVAAVIAAFIVVAASTLIKPEIIPVAAAMIAGMSLMLIPAFFHLRSKLVRYRLTGSTVEIDSGLISRTTQNIPLGRIQDVTVTSTPMQRLLGFGDIVIDNASETGGKIVLKNIDSPRRYAQQLLNEMHTLDSRM